MSRKSLHKLSREFREPQEVKSLLRSLRSESDLTCVIVGTSLIESFLEQLWMNKIEKVSESEISQIFENRGPLSDLQSKILMARACGWISEKIANDLQALRRIRNAFAHSRTNLSFNRPEIREALQSMTLVDLLRVHSPADRPWLGLSVKEQFLLALEIALFLIDSDHRSLGGKRLFPEYRKPGEPIPKHLEQDPELYEVMMIITVAQIINDPERFTVPASADEQP